MSWGGVVVVVVVVAGSVADAGAAPDGDGRSNDVNVVFMTGVVLRRIGDALIEVAGAGIVGVDVDAGGGVGPAIRRPMGRSAPGCCDPASPLLGC